MSYLPTYHYHYILCLIFLPASLISYLRTYNFHFHHLSRIFPPHIIIILSYLLSSHLTLTGRVFLTVTFTRVTVA